MAKIMLVEDDNNLREIYGARLLAEGYEIVTAKDGEEALATAVKEKPDLIISDVMMPRISGFDMLDILRNAPETKHTKVIMMTALSQAEDKARADNLGADRYLVKSQVTLEDVARTVKDVLEGKTEADSTPAPDPGQTTKETPPAPDAPTAEPSVADQKSTETKQEETPAVEPASDTSQTQSVSSPIDQKLAESAESNSAPAIDPMQTTASPANSSDLTPASTKTPATPEPPVAQTTTDPASNLTPNSQADNNQATPANDNTAPSADSSSSTDSTSTTPAFDPTTITQQPSSDPASTTPDSSNNDGGSSQSFSPSATDSQPTTQPDNNSPATQADDQTKSDNQQDAEAQKINVELPKTEEGSNKPDDNTLAEAPTNDSQTSATQEDTQTNSDSDSDSSSIGPNLTEALQAEAGESSESNESTDDSSSPSKPGLKLPVEDLQASQPNDVVAPQTAPEVPQTATSDAGAEQTAPSPIDQSSNGVDSASQHPAQEPANTDPVAANSSPDQPTPSDNKSPENPLNEDPSRKKTVIQPIHDITKGPDLDALAKKQEAIDNANKPVETPSVNTVINPEGTQQNTSQPTQAPEQVGQSGGQQQQPGGGGNQHDIISL